MNQDYLTIARQAAIAAKLERDRAADAARFRARAEVEYATLALDQLRAAFDGVPTRFGTIRVAGDLDRKQPRVVLHEDRDDQANPRIFVTFGVDKDGGLTASIEVPGYLPDVRQETTVPAVLARAAEAVGRRWLAPELVTARVAVGLSPLEIRCLRHALMAETSAAIDRDDSLSRTCKVLNVRFAKLAADHPVP